MQSHGTATLRPPTLQVQLTAVSSTDPPLIQTMTSLGLMWSHTLVAQREPQSILLLHQ